MSETTGDHIRGLNGPHPDGPGCYLFRDGDGRALYVGKAQNLSRRLASYRRAESARTRIMLSQAAEVEWLLLETDQEALISERELIRELKPRWNVKLRDDREYPQIRITDEPVPRIVIERQTGGGGQTAGPYRSRRQAQQLLDLLLECRPVRSCDQNTFRRAERSGRACILADVDRCSAPCVGRVSTAQHRQDMDEIAAFLRGDSRPLLESARRRMKQAAEERRFETAARLRDLAAAAEAAAAAQPVVAPGGPDTDVWGLAEGEQQACLALLRVRGGRIVGHRTWLGEGLVEDMLEEAMRQQYPHGTSADRIYSSIPSASPVPREGARRLIRIRRPERGEGRRLLQRAERNAAEALRRDQNLRRQDRKEQALTELAAILGCGAIRSIEGYDISHLDGRGTCGSQVRFEGGDHVPAATRVRNMREDRNDDPASMRELLERRVARAGTEPLPDLILVDGGAAQLAAAVETLPEGAPVAALAKQEEELWLPGQAPVRLPRSSAALQLLQRIRDEAHRTALRQQRRRRKQDLRSVLEEVPGVGKERAGALRRTFGSLEAIAGASEDELRQAGLPRPVAAAVAAHLQQHLAAAVEGVTVSGHDPQDETAGKDPDAAGDGGD